MDKDNVTALKTVIAIFYGILFLPFFLGIQFQNPHTENFIRLLRTSLPMGLFLLVLLSDFRRKAVRILLLLTLGFLSLFSALGIFMFVLIPNIPREIDRHSLGATDVVAYQTDIAAFTDFNIDLQQEQKLPLGLKLVKRIGSALDATKIDIEIVGDNKIKIVYMDEWDPENTDFQIGQIITLKKSLLLF